MGVDIADVNNDGWPDIYTADMLPEDDYRLKTTSGFEPWALQAAKARAGFGHQQMHNMLQLNNGNSTFHDVGYLSTPEYILRKPSVLAEDEMEEVRVHPVRGAEVFGTQPALAEIARAVRHHHERFDGSGYPEGLRGDEIPLFSRIILVAETYEAMTHHRPYRRALSTDEATRRLRESAGSQLDPEIVKHFLAILGQEPGG